MDGALEVGNSVEADEASILGRPTARACEARRPPAMSGGEALQRVNFLLQASQALASTVRCIVDACNQRLFC